MTSYAKQMTAAGYRKVKVTDLQAGNVVLSYGGGNAVDKTVEKVETARRGLKRVVFTDGTSTTSGNTGKFWTKG